MGKYLTFSTEDRFFKAGGFSIYANPSDPDSFLSFLPELNHCITQGNVLKNSRTTTAVLTSVPGFSGEVFLKRTNNKGFHFTLRYLFRKARVFRAAYAASRLWRNGIPTPLVLAVGEHRSMIRRLDAGYLITESCSSAQPGEQVLQSGESVLPVAELLRKIHDCRMIHGDAKIQNFYRGNGVWGAWDLDGAICYSATPPEEKRLKDLARFALSLTPAVEREQAFRTAVQVYGRFSSDDLKKAAEYFFPGYPDK